MENHIRGKTVWQLLRKPDLELALYPDPPEVYRKELKARTPIVVHLYSEKHDSQSPKFGKPRSSLRGEWIDRMLFTHTLE